MAVITLTCTYDGHFAENGGKDDAKTTAYVGEFWVAAGKSGSWVSYRGFSKYNITKFPARRLPKRVRLYVAPGNAGGSAHLLDIHGYAGDGWSGDPQQDAWNPGWDRCAMGTEYHNDGTELRDVAPKWITLENIDMVAADLRNAKDQAAQIFSLGWHEEGENDPYGSFSTIERGLEYATRLEITYPSGGLPANKALVPMGLM